MTTKTVHEIDDKYLTSFVRQQGIELVLAWLGGNRITTPTVCDILKVSPKTLYNWIHSERLMVTNEGRKPHEFDFSEVVKLYLTKTKKLK